MNDELAGFHNIMGGVSYFCIACTQRKLEMLYKRHLILLCLITFF